MAGKYLLNERDKIEKDLKNLDEENEASSISFSEKYGALSAELGKTKEEV